MHCDWLKAVFPELDGYNPRTQGIRDFKIYNVVSSTTRPSKR